MTRNYYIIGSLIGVLVGGVIIYILIQSGVLGTKPQIVSPPVGTAPAPVPGSSESPPVVTGTSPVAPNGIVVNVFGKTAENSAVAGAPEAPQQSGALEEEEVPGSAIKLVAKLDGFTPNSFEVSAGAAVTLSLASGDGFSYVLKFDDPSLQAVAIGVSATDVRAITFNAPSRKGEYTFYSDVPGHRDSGLTGKMIVE